MDRSSRAESSITRTRMNHPNEDAAGNEELRDILSFQHDGEMTRKLVVKALPRLFTIGVNVIVASRWPRPALRYMTTDRCTLPGPGILCAARLIKSMLRDRSIPLVSCWLSVMKYT